MKLRVVVCVAMMGALLAGSVAAQEKKDPPKKPDAAKPGGKPQEAAKPGGKEAQKEGGDQGMPPEMMAAMMPGEPHKLLASMAGKWNNTVKFWMAENAPEQVSTGPAEYEVIMGGRFVTQKVKSEMMGMPFEGFALHGYDNVKKKFTSVWVDSMGTGMMSSEGTADASGKVINYTWEYADPMSGKVKKGRAVQRMEPNKMVYEMYETGPDGKEFRALEVTSTK